MWLILLFIEHYGKIKKYANTLLCLVYTYIEVSFRIIVYCLLGAATVDFLAYWHQGEDRTSLVKVDFVLKVMTREFHVYSYVGSAQFIKKDWLSSVWRQIPIVERFPEFSSSYRDNLWEEKFGLTWTQSTNLQEEKPCQTINDCGRLGFTGNVVPPKPTTTMSELYHNILEIRVYVLKIRELFFNNFCIYQIVEENQNALSTHIIKVDFLEISTCNTMHKHLNKTLVLFFCFISFHNKLELGLHQYQKSYNILVI